MEEMVVIERANYDALQEIKRLHTEMLNRLEVLIYDECDRVKDLQKSSGNSTYNFGKSAYLYIEDIAKRIDFDEEYQAFVNECEIIRKNNEVKDIAEGGEEE